MLGFSAGFIIGGVAGVYAAQNYEVPKIRDIVSDLKGMMKKYEKKDGPKDTKDNS